MPIARFIFAVIAFYVLVQKLIRYLRHEKNQTFFKLLTTYFVWVPILVIVIYPEFAYSLSQILGFGKTLNTLIFIAFIVVFIIIFKLLNLIEILERNLTELVRFEALRNWRKHGK